MSINKVIFFKLTSDLLINLSAAWFGLVLISPTITSLYFNSLTASLLSGILYFVAAYIIQIELKKYEH